MNIRIKLNNLYFNLFPQAIVDPNHISFEHLVDIVMTELLKQHKIEHLTKGIIDIKEEVK